MNAELKILFVEDSIGDAELIWHEIGRNKISFEKLLVDNTHDFLEALKVFVPDLIISDYSLPKLNGMAALLLRNENSPFIPFLLVTGSINEEVAVDCIKAGADDYILKDNLSRLVPAIFSSLNKSKLTKEKKAAEDELLRSEQRLQKAQSIAHVGNWEYDLSSRMVWCSDEALAIYGFDKTQKELPIEAVRSVPVPEFRPILDEAFDDLLKHNEAYEAEFKIKRINDGEIRTVFSKAELVVEPDQQVKVIGVIQDITDRKKTEQAIIESELRYRNIFENIQDIYYETNSDGIILNVSPSIETFSKGLLKREEIIGKSMLDFYNDPAERNNLLTSIMEKGCVTDFEVMLKNSDGSVIPCSISAKINYDDFANPTKIIGSVRDISERKKNEAELIRAKVKAEESDKLKTAFLHNISHEIRTPLNAIVGFSALLGEPDLEKHSRESYVEVIMQSSNHLLQIISDIVDISNIEANLIKTSKKEVNINRLLKSLVSQYTTEASRKQIDLTYENALPDEDAVILTDNTKLNQVLTNLLSNALKFTENGSIKIWYSIHENILELNVSDTGIGIAPEHFNKIFERFYQVQNSVSRLYEGTGLGLSISKAYIEFMGGKIWLNSKQGEGSTFSFTLPYEKAHKEIDEVKDIVRENVLFPGEKRLILIAEDVESNFKLIKYFLSGSNVEIIHAANGKEAVEKCLAIPGIDLILMDVKMPVMDGYTAVKLIREKNTRIPIIAQTAYVDDREKAMNSGCSGFISKPFDKKDLLRILKEFI